MNDDDRPLKFAKDEQSIKEIYSLLSFTVEDTQFLPTLKREYGHRLVIDLGNLRCWAHVNELGQPEIKWQMRICDHKNGVDNQWLSLY